MKSVVGFEIINKKQSELTIKDFYDGQRFYGEVTGEMMEGKIRIEHGEIFLCQNRTSGDACDIKHGYKYSYRITTDKTLRIDGSSSGINVKNLMLEQNIPPLQKVGNAMDIQWYVNIVGLKDTADERLMENFTSDFSFVGFSKANGGPIFKLKDNNQTEKYWQEEVISKINEIGGMINMVSDLSKHI